MEKPYLTDAPKCMFHSSARSPAVIYDPIDCVLLFKTNIKTQSDKIYVKTVLDKHPLITQWNIDMEDIDGVLRIVSAQLNHQDIIKLVIEQCGFYCEELF